MINSQVFYLSPGPFLTSNQGYPSSNWPLEVTCIITFSLSRGSFLSKWNHAGRMNFWKWTLLKDNWNMKCTHCKCKVRWVLTNVYTPVESPPPLSRYKMLSSSLKGVPLLSIPLCGHNTTCLCIHLLRYNWATSTFWLLWLLKSAVNIHI